MLLFRANLRTVKNRTGIVCHYDAKSEYLFRIDSRKGKNYNITE